MSIIIAKAGGGGLHPHRNGFLHRSVIHGDVTKFSGTQDRAYGIEKRLAMACRFATQKASHRDT
jgi:hypothetical protein